MREPMKKFPQRPTGLAYARRTLAEIQAILKKPRLSAEMRSGLEQRVIALQSEIASDNGKQTTSPLVRTSRIPPNSTGK